VSFLRPVLRPALTLPCDSDDDTHLMCMHTPHVHAHTSCACTHLMCMQIPDIKMQTTHVPAHDACIIRIYIAACPYRAHASPLELVPSPDQITQFTAWLRLEVHIMLGSHRRFTCSRIAALSAVGLTHSVRHHSVSERCESHSLSKSLSGTALESAVPPLASRMSVSLVES
jgi:hypothetical protein